MANKRILKKQIQYICSDIAAECFFACEYIPGIDNSKMHPIIAKLAVLQKKTLTKTNFSYDKTPRDFENAKEYNKARRAFFNIAFSSIKDKFNTEILEIVKEMNSLLPQEQRMKNKAAASSK
ncbi:MAG: hypothetical protein J1E84_05845 [Muribaculaceae bacterium]|nr:hypothetical protein [Muribaculaceae bacterium]